MPGRAGDGNVGPVFTRDDILVWILAYEFGSFIGVFVMFPEDLVNALRDFAQQFLRAQQWTASDRHGHFPSEALR